MNNAKMWLVVSPSVGVPLFLGAVAVGSFAVHVAVLSNTSWVADFLSGQELGAGDEMAAAMTLENVEASQAAYALDLDEATQEVTVVLPDGTIARAVLQRDDVLASATLPLQITSN
jgi:light-harvesting protein B-800-850 alpha chain